MIQQRRKVKKPNSYRDENDSEEEDDDHDEDVDPTELELPEEQPQVCGFCICVQRFQFLGQLLWSLTKFIHESIIDLCACQRTSHSLGQVCAAPAGRRRQWTWTNTKDRDTDASEAQQFDLVPRV